MGDVAKDILDALAKAGLRDYFSGLAPSHQREYLKWIEEAKKAETRRRRMARALTMMAEKNRQKRAPAGTKS